MPVIARDELVHRIAAELDKPSVFMGGPSRQSRRKAEAIVALLPDYQGAVEAVDAGRRWTEPYCKPDAPLAEQITALVSACSYWHAVAEGGQSETPAASDELQAPEEDL